MRSRLEVAGAFVRALLSRNWRLVRCLHREARLGRDDEEDSALSSYPASGETARECGSGWAFRSRPPRRGG